LTFGKVRDRRYKHLAFVSFGFNALAEHAADGCEMFNGLREVGLGLDGGRAKMVNGGVGLDL
jgi:hypothetical protein